MDKNDIHNGMENLDDLIYNSDGDKNDEEIKNEKRKDSMNSKNSEEIKTKEEDLRSIFVKNLDFNSTKEEIKEFFEEAGSIERVTIIYDKFFKVNKGFCYVQFKNIEDKEKSFKLTEKLFKGRKLEILPKRTNIPFKKKKNLNNKNKKFPFKKGFNKY